jgi:hypothetical protein
MVLQKAFLKLHLHLVAGSRGKITERRLNTNNHSKAVRRHPLTPRLLKP